MEAIKQVLWYCIDAIKQFNFTDFLDVLIVTFLLYSAIKFIRETRAVQLIKGILLLLVIFLLSEYLRLTALNAILTYFFQFAFVSLIIVFQPEIRRALEQVGKSKVGKSIASAVNGLDAEGAQKEVRKCISAVVEAVTDLQRAKMGALIVFERGTRLGEIAETGTIVDAQASPTLIGNVFFNKAPLHDGAMIIRGGKVYAAGCILPLTSNDSISAELGTRHRAAIGMSENSDAVVVVVSEETGQISIARNGVLTRNYNRETLSVELEQQLFPKDRPAKEKSSDMTDGAQLLAAVKQFFARLAPKSRQSRASAEGGEKLPDDAQKKEQPDKNSEP